MAIDLDKISSELEDALEQARVLAEQRNHSRITPSHMFYVLLDKESSLPPCWKNRAWLAVRCWMRSPPVSTKAKKIPNSKRGKSNRVALTA